MRVYLRDGSAQTILRAATLRQKLQIQLSISPSHSILTPGQPIPALTLKCQAPGRVATGVPILSHWYDLTLEKSQCKWDSNLGSPSLEADTLTTRPMRRFMPGTCGVVSVCVHEPWSLLISMWREVILHNL